MKNSLIINGGAEVELSHSELAELASNLSDEPTNAGLFAELAGHPSSRVRMAVASKNNLPTESQYKLTTDPCIEVVQRLLFSESALNVFDRKTLLGMLRRDVGIALSMVEDGLYRVKPSVRKVVIAELKNHEDPDVGEALITHLQV